MRHLYNPVFGSQVLCSQGNGRPLPHPDSSRNLLHACFIDHVAIKGCSKFLHAVKSNVSSKR